MTEPVKVSDWPKPDAVQARFYAAAVEAGLDGGLVLHELLPDVPVERLSVLCERWDRTREVRAARFDVREWLEKSAPDKIAFALEKSRNQMAAFLATHQMAELKDSQLAKALKFMEALEKVVAGTAGKGDAASDFFQKVMSGEIKLGKAQEGRAH